MGSTTTASLFFSALYSIFILHAALLSTGAEAVGVCYGRNGNNLPNTREVIELYKSNGIGKIRIYSPDEATLDALKGSHIHVMVDIPNDQLQSLTTPAAAKTWVQKYIQPRARDVQFRYIAVGNEVFSTNRNNAQFVLPAMENIYSAIAAANLQQQIQVSTAIETKLLDPKSFPPQEASFSVAANQFITPIIKFLVKNHSPLLANVYPYFAYANDPNIKLAYALFTSTPEGNARNGTLEYRNLFDAMVDALYAAVEKSGGRDVPIVISESGWPSEGGKGATVENAGTYYKNLISHVKTRKGTPKKPGKDIHVYLFSMFDENLKGPGEVEKHFGLFKPSKQPKYQLSFK